MTHDWSVGFVVDTSKVQLGVAHYEARCSCGWRWVADRKRDEDTSEVAAARAAHQHATGRLAEDIEKPKRHRGPLQTDRLFDPDAA